MTERCQGQKNASQFWCKYRNSDWQMGLKSRALLLCLRPLVLITGKYNWEDGDEVKAQYNFNKIVQSSMLCLAILVQYLVSPSPIQKTLSSLLWTVLCRQLSQRDIIPKFCRSLEDILFAFQPKKIPRFIVTTYIKFCFCKRCFKEHDVNDITRRDHQDADFLVKIKNVLTGGKLGERLRKSTGGF